MKKKWMALLLAALLVPLALASAAENGSAQSRMEACCAVIGGDQSLTIRSEVFPGGPGGYCQAVYAVELTGEETWEELDALGRELVTEDAAPVWGGSKHCYHGSGHSMEAECTIDAAVWEPGVYLYVCYAFGCEGGSYNHILTPYYEEISTMAVRVTEQAQGLELRYALVDEQGNQSAEVSAGDEMTLELGGGVQTLMLLSDVEYPVERILSVEADFPEEQPAEAFTFDETTLQIDPVLCGSGSVTVTIGGYLDDATRTEMVFLRVPCASEAEPTVVQENTCTEDGLAEYRCHGYGVNCETVYEQQILPAYGHELFSVNQIVVKPTATLPGMGTGTCKNCGIIGVEQELAPIFSDVAADGYYSRALDYCYDRGWVAGVSANTFAPDNVCVRSQVVTFLWRAAGCPEAVERVNPFEDVKEGDYYYEAVLWAVEQGITKGIDAAHFAPKGVCNRSQVVTFLWRAFGQPQCASMEHPFTDVRAGSWYEIPVIWAVEQGITSGMSADRFDPNADCSRAQIVTFLHRAYAE